METTETFELKEATTANIKNAIEQIEAFAKRRNLSLEGETKISALKSLSLSLTGIKFPSKKAEKRFRWSITRISRKQTMKSANLFFRQLQKATGISISLEYSLREKKIRAARKEWKELQAKTEEARLKYKEIKGDFYWK